MKISVLYDSGIVKSNTNGERTQTVIYTNPKSVNEKFKICIGSFVSKWATLLKWSDSVGWMLIIQKDIKRDYKIDITYSENFKQTDYKPIIEDLADLSTNF